MPINIASLEGSIQKQIDGDTEFQSSLATLSDEEKGKAIASKKTELLDKEIQTLGEKAEKLAKVEELANNYKIRSEKAEGELKNIKPSNNDGKSNNNLSTKDIIAITEAKVHPDDIDEVVEYASFKKIGIAEALKTDIIKDTLAKKSEFRKTADAANAGTARKPASKLTDEQLIEKANKGELPDTDEGMQALAAARMRLRKAKKL